MHSCKWGTLSIVGTSYCGRLQWLELPLNTVSLNSLKKAISLATIYVWGFAATTRLEGVTHPKTKLTHPQNFWSVFSRKSVSYIVLISMSRYCALYLGWKSDFSMLIIISRLWCNLRRQPLCWSLCQHQPVVKVAMKTNFPWTHSSKYSREQVSEYLESSRLTNKLSFDVGGNTVQKKEGVTIVCFITSVHFSDFFYVNNRFWFEIYGNRWYKSMVRLISCCSYWEIN